MNKTAPNEPAHPIIKPLHSNYLNKGLTKREDFAKTILAGFVASEKFGFYSIAERAKMAVDQADALIVALNK